MIAAHLVETLAAEIRDATANIKMPVEYHNERERRMESTWQKINVFEMYIPEDLFDNSVYYPLIVVEWLMTKDRTLGENKGSLATIGLSFGVFGKEYDGWKDCVHLMEVVRERLLTKRTLANKYRLTGEITWQTAPAEKQPRPFFYGYTEIIYQLYQPQEEYYGESHLYWTQCRGRDDQSAFH